MLPWSCKLKQSRLALPGTTERQKADAATHGCWNSSQALHRTFRDEGRCEASGVAAHANRLRVITGSTAHAHIPYRGPSHTSRVGCQTNERSPLSVPELSNSVRRRGKRTDATSGPLDASVSHGSCAHCPRRRVVTKPDRHQQNGCPGDPPLSRGTPISVGLCSRGTRAPRRGSPLSCSVPTAAGAHGLHLLSPRRGEIPRARVEIQRRRAKPHPQLQVETPIEESRGPRFAAVPGLGAERPVVVPSVRRCHRARRACRTHPTSARQRVGRVRARRRCHHSHECARSRSAIQPRRKWAESATPA